MSSKKSNLNSKDHQYMNLAINLAKDRIGFKRIESICWLFNSKE